MSNIVYKYSKEINQLKGDKDYATKISVIRTELLCNGDLEITYGLPALSILEKERHVSE